MGFRSPEFGTGWLIGLEVASSSQPTRFLDVPVDWFGDSADEFGVMLDAVLAVVSFRRTRPKNDLAFDPWLSDSRGGVGGLGAVAGSCRVRDICARGTMTAISRNEMDKLHRDAQLFHPVLLHGSCFTVVDFLGSDAMFIVAYPNATHQP